MGGVVILVYIIALVIGFILAWYLANCFYEIACEKGFEENKYFWIPFWLGIIGYLLVAALPDRKKAEQPKSAKPLFAPAVTEKPVGKWACPDCGNVLPDDVVQCNCGYKRYLHK